MSSNVVLVFNCGSSSIKFAIIEPVSGEEKINGLVERINTEQASFSWTINGEKNKQSLKNLDYSSALERIVSLLREYRYLVDHLVAVGHRVVHGGEYFSESTIVDQGVLDKIDACSDLAPLHNPANSLGIKTLQQAFPLLPQVAVFDTAFHHTIPDYAYIYALPYEFYKKYNVRRYGFHGTSHRYVTKEAARILNKPYDECALISAHLGNGCSVAAVLNGQCVDTSMGITPLEGLVMGTRSGDMDPSLHAYLAEKLGKDVYEITKIFNKESGLLGVSGLSGDMRSVTEAAEQGHKQAALAIEIFCYRLAKYILSYCVPLGRLDALIFTGGIGENAANIREKVLAWLKLLKFEIDEEKNKNNGRLTKGYITQSNSLVALVIPTKEELLIARDAINLVK